MRKVILSGCLLAIAALVPAASAQRDLSVPSAPHGPGPTSGIEIGHIPKCLEAAPAAIGIPIGAAPLPLTARVLLEGVPLDKAQSAMSRAATAYSPLGISLVVDSYDVVTFAGTDAQSLINQSRAHFGGGRPVGADVVYLMTSKNIQLGGNNAVAGLADCIGGYAFADRAFAVGEATPGQFNNSLFSYELPAKIAAHEVGHLMGAHHHYANCAEGIQATDVGGDLGSPCSLMFNDVGLLSLKFSTVNGLVVRGHIEEF